MSEKGPVINRSKVQLATSYAPGALFTFEGGRGCFLSVPVLTNRYDSNIIPIVTQQIEEQMKEIISNWFNTGINCRSASGPPVYPEQILERAAFLDYRDQPTFDVNQFILLEPAQMGYYPDPLNFVCAKCGLLHKYTDVDDYARNHKEQENRNDCKKSVGNGKHQWSQLDVVFAHWSGNYEALSPERACECGNKEFYLIKSTTGIFSDWKFKCSKEGCPSIKDITRNDPKTKELLEEKMRQGTMHQPKEMRMLPVSYRASSLYYVQTDRFIPYPDTSIFELLHPAKHNELADELLTIYNYPQQPISDEKIKMSLESVGQAGAYLAYSEMKKVIATVPGAAEVLREQVDKLLFEWIQKGWIENTVTIPSSLMAKVRERHEYARRFDPIRLAIEHSLLEKKQLIISGGLKKTTVDLFNPPPDVAPDGISKQEAKAEYQNNLHDILNKLGIKRMLMLRELDLVQYSFGYTRVSASPTTIQKGLTMPVCLRAFEPVKKGQRPIYVLHQKNEAFYVQLDEAKVVEWLAKNNLDITEMLSGGLKFGAKYIEFYENFGPFLDIFKSQKGDVLSNICNMTYMLLHTIAHQLIVTISEYSGLEQSSFGEYLFPADLAFVVYRSGMTPDLGNLSSMWRNFNIRVLEQMLSTKKLQCSSGSLCDHRGGACPGCIMLPETSCVAANQLLSRSVLKNGPVPRWSSSNSDMVGYFSVTAG